MSLVTCDAQEVQHVKDELVINPNNVGVGILHEPTGLIHLAPFDDLHGGHDQLVFHKKLAAQECRGFVVVRLPDGSFDAVNNSHLNGPQGSPGSLLMPVPLFQTIVQVLRQAGL